MRKVQICWQGYIGHGWTHQQLLSPHYFTKYQHQLPNQKIRSHYEQSNLLAGFIQRGKRLLLQTIMHFMYILEVWRKAKILALSDWGHTKTSLEHMLSASPALKRISPVLHIVWSVLTIPTKPISHLLSFPASRWKYMFIQDNRNIFHSCMSSETRGKKRIKRKKEKSNKK
jgi:hypothetical protein